MCFPSIAGIRHGESLPKYSKQAMLFLSPKVLGIDTEPPQTVGLYVSQGLFPTKGVFAEWQDPVHDEEYNELKDPAAGLMFHLSNQKKSKNNEVNCNYYENKKLRNTLSPRTSHVYNAIQFKR